MAAWGLGLYRGTSIIRNSAPLGLRVEEAALAAALVEAHDGARPVMCIVYMTYTCIYDTYMCMYDDIHTHLSYIRRVRHIGQTSRQLVSCLGARPHGGLLQEQRTGKISQ